MEPAAKNAPKESCNKTLKVSATNGKKSFDFYTSFFLHTQKSELYKPFLLMSKFLTLIINCFSSTLKNRFRKIFLGRWTHFTKLHMVKNHAKLRTIFNRFSVLPDFCVKPYTTGCCEELHMKLKYPRSRNNHTERHWIRVNFFFPFRFAAQLP